MKRKVLALTLIFMFLALALGSIKVAYANSDESFPILAMPIEYVNYTITAIKGSLWATIDGDYPIYVSNQPDYGSISELPIVYPMPPNTTNIHVYLADKEVSWTNYTQTYPNQLHQTAIGDWWMIYSVLSNVSDFFELKIHYEHPLEVVNGSYLFLYDLNITPYLSLQNNNSTAYFTVRMETNTTKLHAFITQTDTTRNPITYTTAKDGSTDIVAIQIYSEYAKSTGDLVVEFSNSDQTTVFPLWTLPIFAVAIFAIILLYKKVGRGNDK